MWVFKKKAWHLQLKIGLAFTCIIFGWIAIGLLITNFINHPEKIWFKGLDYFTIQCNLMILAYCICYLINLKKKFLKSPRFMIYVGAYSMVMFIIYNVVLLPQDIGATDADHGLLYWMGSVIRHEIIPVCFFTLILICGLRKEWLKTGKLWSCVGVGMIYPLCYTVYALFIPLARADGSTSVYGTFSNVWSNRGGGPSNLAYIVMTVVLFIVTLVFHWYLLNNWWIRKNRKAE